MSGYDVCVCVCVCVCLCVTECLHMSRFLYVAVRFIGSLHGSKDCASLSMWGGRSEERVMWREGERDRGEKEDGGSSKMSMLT